MKIAWIEVKDDWNGKWDQVRATAVYLRRKCGVFWGSNVQHVSYSRVFLQQIQLSLKNSRWARAFLKKSVF